MQTGMVPKRGLFKGGLLRQERAKQSSLFPSRRCFSHLSLFVALALVFSIFSFRKQHRWNLCCSLNRSSVEQFTHQSCAGIVVWRSFPGTRINSSNNLNVLATEGRGHRCKGRVHGYANGTDRPDDNHGNQGRQ